MNGHPQRKRTFADVIVEFLMVNWKVWVTLVVLCAAIFFAVNRYRAAVAPKAPSWMNLRQGIGPALQTRWSTDASWEIIKPFIEQVRRDSIAHLLPIGTVIIHEYTSDPSTIILWTAEQLINPGFAPLKDFERMNTPRDGDLMGFYTLNGDPIPYTLRNAPNSAQMTYITINMTQSVEPGKTEVILRRQQAPATSGMRAGTVGASAASTNQPGRISVWMPPMPPPIRAIHARAVLLPKGAGVSRFSPPQASIVATNERPFLAWINSNNSSNTPAVTMSFVMRAEDLQQTPKKSKKSADRNTNSPPIKAAAGAKGSNP
jgi:hypothetical protein